LKRFGNRRVSQGPRDARDKVALLHFKYAVAPAHRMGSAENSAEEPGPSVSVAFALRREIFFLNQTQLENSRSEPGPNPDTSDPGLPTLGCSDSPRRGCQSFGLVRGLPSQPSHSRCPVTPQGPQQTSALPQHAFPCEGAPSLGLSDDPDLRGSPLRACGTA
jgi:hypothetical protein